MYYLYKRCNINWLSSLPQKLIIVRLFKNKVQVIRIFISIQESFYFNSSDSSFNSPLKHYYIKITLLLSKLYVFFAKMYEIFLIVLVIKLNT